MRLPFRSALALSAVSLTALLASCGGDDVKKVDADDWAEDVCDRAADFERDFGRAGRDLNVINDGEPDEIKETVEEFAKATSELIDEFVGDIEEIGEPDIEGGGDVLDAIREHADDQKGSINGFKDEVNDLDEDDEDEFREDVLDLLDDAEEFDLRDRFEDIDERDVDDLTDTIDDDPACSATMFNS